MLEASLTEQLRDHLTRITDDVELIATLDDGPKSVEMLAFLEEVTALSPKLTVSTEGNDTRRPSFVIRRSGTDVEVTFAAIPLGHELTSFVLALLQVGGHPSPVDQVLQDRIRGLEGTFAFETYLSLSCQNCPDVVQALDLMSVLNPGISHVAIDGALHRDEADERQVMAVPTVFLNGEPFGQGRMTLAEIVDRLDTGAAQAESERLAAEAPYDLLIVGGGPAGATASIYAARKGIRTGLITQRFGGQVLDTMSIENFVSVPGTDGPRLAADMERHVAEHDIDVVTNRSVTALEPATAPGEPATVILDGDVALSARAVVIATGARWRHIGVPGEEEYRNKGVTYCPHCDGPLFVGKRVAVIGGGNSGVEAAIDLAGVVAHVTLIEFDDELRADDVLKRKLASLDNTRVILSAQTTEILGDGSRVTGLTYRDRHGGREEQLELDGVFVQIGLLPNTEWLGDTLELSPHGEIVVDDRGQTSAEGIYAAGDCTTEPFKQIVVAMGAGSTAALGAFDHLIRTSAPAPSDGAEMATVPS